MCTHTSVPAHPACPATACPLGPHHCCALPQVKVQTVPGYARGIADGLPKFVQQEGVGGLFKGLTPLWGRQIPYTMMKFGQWAGCMGVCVGAKWGRGGHARGPLRKDC